MFSEKIKFLREENNLSQTEFGKLFDLKQHHITSYENKKAEPSIETLNKIADYFKVSVDYLVGHATQGLTEIGYLTPEQKSLVKQITRLNQANLFLAQGYIMGLLAAQN